MEIIDIINGNLLADGSVRSDKGKYFTFQVVAKSEKFLKRIGNLLKKFKIKFWISKNKSDLFLLGFYINSCLYPELIYLRERWYKKMNGKTVKVIPRDLKLTPTTLLFWYLGDGSLIRRKNDPNRVPFIVLATNNFSKEDVNFLIQKLKELKLNFYPVKYKSGFTSKAAGLFDTEGNVNKWDENLRISQLTLDKIDLIDFILRQEKYNFRYDGCNFVLGNLKETRTEDFKNFERQVLPYMKNKIKIKEAVELFSGNLIRPSFNEVAKIIANKPGVTQKELSKVFDRRMYRALKALVKQNYVRRADCPIKYFITLNGFRWFGGGDVS